MNQRIESGDLLDEVVVQEEPRQGGQVVQVVHFQDSLELQPEVFGRTRDVILVLECAMIF